MEAVKGGGNVVGHGNVTGAAEVIPFQVQAEVGGAGPVGSDGVEGSEGGEEVLGMRSSDGFDAEVVDDEGEENGASVVPPESRGVAGGGVAVLGEVDGEAFIGQLAGLGKAIHPLPDFNQDVTVVHKWCKVVLGHYAGRDGPNRDSHVFVPLHGSVEVEV